MSVQLGPGDVAVDCGANVGDVTALLARGGATVHAFEPNPVAFAELERRFEGVGHVRCHRQAVAVGAGPRRLFLHERAEEDGLRWSTGSSLLSAKPNVRQESFVKVETVDLCDFLRGLGVQVRLLKLDVEGAEVELLDRLLDTGLVHSIDHIFVETHEEKIPELRVGTRALRVRLRHLGLSHVNLDWL